MSSLYSTTDWKNAKAYNRSIEDCVTIAEIREHQLCKPLAEAYLFDLTLRIDGPADQNADSNSQVPPVPGEDVEMADADSAQQAAPPSDPSRADSLAAENATLADENHGIIPRQRHTDEEDETWMQYLSGLTIFQLSQVCHTDPNDVVAKQILQAKQALDVVKPTSGIASGFMPGMIEARRLANEKLFAEQVRRETQRRQDAEQEAQRKALQDAKRKEAEDRETARRQEILAGPSTVHSGIGEWEYVHRRSGWMQRKKGETEANEERAEASFVPPPSDSGRSEDPEETNFPVDPRDLEEPPYRIPAADKRYVDELVARYYYWELRERFHMHGPPYPESIGKALNQLAISENVKDDPDRDQKKADAKKATVDYRVAFLITRNTLESLTVKWAREKKAKSSRKPWNHCNRMRTKKCFPRMHVLCRSSMIPRIFEGF